MDEQKKENRYQLVKRVGHINTAVKLFKIAFESENYTIECVEALEMLGDQIEAIKRLSIALYSESEDEI